MLARSREASSPDDLSEASKDFQKELQLDSSNANAAYELGDIYRTSGQLKEAQEAFELALKSHPDFEEAHLGLAAVLLLLGQPAVALPHLQRALALIMTTPCHGTGWREPKRPSATLPKARRRTPTQRLRQKPSEHLAQPIFTPDEVTRQKIESNPAQ